MNNPLFGATVLLFVITSSFLQASDKDNSISLPIHHVDKVSADYTNRNNKTTSSSKKQTPAIAPSIMPAKTELIPIDLKLPNRSILCSQIESQISDFRTEAQLTSLENINCNASTKRIEGLLTNRNRLLLNEYVVIKRGTININYYPSIVVKRVEQFLQQEGIVTQAESVIYDSPNNPKRIYYELFCEKAEKFKSLVDTIEERPMSLLVQIKLISASNNVQQEFATMFSATKKWGPENDAGEVPNSAAFLSKFTGTNPLLMATKVNPKSVLNLALNALAQDGNGRRSIFSDITTTDSMIAGWEPQKFSQTQNIPTIYSSNQQGTQIQNNKVGLDLTLQSISILNSKQYLEEKERLEADFKTFLDLYKPQIDKINNALNNGIYNTLNLRQLDSLLNQIDSFNQRARKINRLVQFRVKLSLKDGGVVREIVTNNSIATATNESQYELDQTLENGVPRFLAGTSGFQIKGNSSKIPLLGDIPIIKYLFTSKSDSRVEDGVMGFITVSVLDESNEAKAVTSYIQKDTQYIVPLNLGGLAYNSANTDPLATAIPSTLKWLYDTNSESVITARNKIQSLIGEKLLASMFARSFYQGLEEIGVRGIQWHQYEVMREKVNRMRTFDGWPEAKHPIVSMLKKIQSDYQKITDNNVSLSLIEILAIARDQGRIGRAESADITDERLFMYLVWLVAKYHDSSVSIFQNSHDLNTFENNGFLLSR